MRNAWLKTFTILAVSTALVGTSVFANPANFAMSRRTAAKPTVSTTPTTGWQQANAGTPAGAVETSKLESAKAAIKHPVKSISSAMTPITSKFKRGDKSTHPTMVPTQPHNDPISLSNPIGAPTPELYICTAQMSEQNRDIGRARQQFKEALGMWPNHVEVLRAAARMEDRLGNLAAAEQLYQQAAVSNPQHAGALNDLGICLARQGRLDASIQALEQSVQLQPAKAIYRNNAATVLVEMHQDQRALGHLAAVNGSAEASYNLGQLLVSRGRAADAAPYFQTAIQQNPSLQAAQVALANLQNSGVVTAQAPVAQQAVPVAPTMVAPQQNFSSGPQLGYPSTARTPDYNTSGSMPRYLPPVASQPGAPLHR